MDFKTDTMILIMTIFILKSTVSATFSADVVSNSPYSSNSRNPHSVKSKSGRIFSATEIYQPKYICDSLDASKGVTHPAWHHSCVTSCKDTYEKDLVNITLVDWEPTGIDIDVYKISMSEVCYTSHENLWGYCSQAQSVDPKAPSKEEARKVVASVTDNWKSKSPGTRFIKNSKEADCGYFEDTTTCNNDYTIIHKTGTIYKKTEHSNAEVLITEDGIRTELSQEFLKLNDAVWVWKIKDHTTDKCGWKEGIQISCHHKNESFILECPDIGHSFSLDSIKKSDTCQGEIFGVENLLPFKYVGSEKQSSRFDTEKRLEDDQTKDRTAVAIVKGMNQALTSLEITYCNSFCDVFTNLYLTKENDVIQTPLGPWVMGEI